MAYTKVLVDTSIIIDFLRKKEKQRTIFWEIVNNYICYVSSITHFELFCGANSPSKIKDLEKLMKWVNILEFNEDISLVASKLFLSLKRINKGIEFRDIFIAATAINQKIPLATLNTKHFERISNLELL